MSMMDLFIETLTGTAFELRVSPYDTIISIKAKIQRLEGIPISQQHLIWQSVELDDDLCLHDFDITDGATIKLVLAMRGGPINTRRISVEDPSLEEMAEYMEANRSEIFDKLMKDNRQVTLLVFRDGDQLNFFRVHDRGDGTLTPLSESLSAASMHNLYDEEEDEDQGISQEKKDENDQTKKKMQILRAQMANLSLKKKPRFVPRPPSSGRPGSSLAKRRLRFANPNRSPPQKDSLTVEAPRERKSSHHRSRRRTTDPEQPQQQSNSKNMLPPVTSKNRNTDLVDVSDIISASNIDSKFIQDLSKTTRHLEDNDRTLPPKPERNYAKEILMKNARAVQPLKPLSRRDSSSGRDLLKSVNSLLRRENPSPNEETPTKDNLDDNEEYWNVKTSLEWKNASNISNSSGESTKLRKSGKLKSRMEKNMRKDSLPETDLKLKRRQRLCSPEEIVTEILREPVGRNYTVSLDTKNGGRLPHVESKSKIPPQLMHNSRKRARCFLCGKKLGLATNYQCRCGNIFCATHRYAETHNCTYDYKTEGRKVLEQSNPVVTAPKLPKI